MIRRFRIRGYKSFDNAELPLEPLTVLFGPNASGKTNTFDALGLLKRMALLPTLSEAMDAHRGAALEAFRLAEGGLSELLRNKTTSLTLEADVWLSPRAMARVEESVRLAGEHAGTRRKVVEKFLRYALTVEFSTDTGSLRVKDEKLIAIRRDGMVRLGRDPFIAKEAGEIQARMEGQDQNVPARTRGTALSAPLYVPHHPHVAAFREEVAGWNFFHLNPSRLAADSSLVERFLPGPLGDGLAACLNTLKAQRPDDFAELNANLNRLVPEVKSVDVSYTSTGDLRLMIRENGKSLPARLASAGTLRVVGLLAVIAGSTPDALIGLEEPENGVHPARLEVLAEILHERTGRDRHQVIMNTHSPILANMFSRDHLVLCRKEESATLFTPVNALEPLFRQPEIDKVMEL